MSSVSFLIPLLWAIQIPPVTFSLIILSPVIVLPNCVERDSKNVIYCDLLWLSPFSGNIKSCPAVSAVKAELSVQHFIDFMSDGQFNF